MIRRVLDLYDFQVVAICKRHHLLYELRAKTRVVRTVVEVDHQLSDVKIADCANIPLLVKTIGNKVARFAGSAKDDHQQVFQYIVNAKRNYFFL